ncbi:autophagy-related protein 27 [Aspergillus egyptiacus]|nr:autophagy-related protein 27 [Aspergillus egyptiacus]
MRIHASSLLSAASLLSGVTAAINFDCEHIKVDGWKYNLKPLGGVHSLYHAETVDGSVVNTTYVLNVCGALRDGAIRGRLNCGTTRNIGAFQDTYSDSHHETSFAFPIAGYDHMGHGAKDPEVTRLKDLDPESLGGLRLKLGGGKYPVDDKEKDTSAVIDFVCDPERSGLEGLGEEVERLLRAREESEDDGEDEDKEPFYDGSDPDRSLQFKGFNQTDDGSYVLNLNWRTRYACDDYLEDHGSSSGHWGFFTWLIIIFFLCAAAYLIFGSWLNYNRYGARGWDLLPHSDTIRDIPYLFQDWLRRVVNTFQGSGSRGGYSAV